MVNMYIDESTNKLIKHLHVIPIVSWLLADCKRWEDVLMGFRWDNRDDIDASL